jgi:hypothetical protein
MTFARRAAASAASLALGAAVLAGCSSNGASTSCGLNACTVTFDRGVDASASVLGVDAKLVGVQGETVTVEVAGQRLGITAGQQAAQVGGLSVTLESVTDKQAVVRITKN